MAGFNLYCLVWLLAGYFAGRLDEMRSNRKKKEK